MNQSMPWAGARADSVFEEVKAYQYESYVDSKLGIYYQFVDQFNKYDLSLSGKALNDKLEEAKQKLGEAGGSAGNMYKGLPLLPPNNPAYEVRTDFKMLLNLIGFGWY